jgi:hypothetical protein
MTTPSMITQWAEDPSHIGWENIGLLPSSTSYPLLHIAREPRNDIKMKTHFVYATGFDFTYIPEVISGVQFILTVDRGGRIHDETIQLMYNNQLIGENKASQFVDPTQVYGSTTDVWNVTNISSQMIQDPSFGIALRFKSHPAWPHKTTAILRLLDLQIH